MSVRIITGNIGSGKTQYCICDIEKVHKADAERKCIMLVPSHYSHETERLLISKFGGTGINNIECTSFEKLAQELLPTAAKRLGLSGKNALICRSISMVLQKIKDCGEKFDRRLVRAITKNGFVDIAASLLSELHRYNVSADTVLDYSKTEENPVLAQKLEILSMIDRTYMKLLENTDYVDADDDLIRLSHVIGKSINDGVSIWLLKFDEFLPQQFEVVKALIDSGADITMTFNTCDDNTDTYYGTKNAIAAVSEYTSVERIHLDGAMEHVKAPELKFLFTSWFNREVYTGECSNAELFIARDAYTETEHTARKILDLVREGNYRFSDIGILCGNTDSYLHIIEAVFDEYEIPYYTDNKLAISEYPIAMQVLSLFDIINNNWSYASMFSYLRSGFIYTKVRTDKGRIKYRRISPDDIDLLENYVLKYGISYKSGWCRSWLDETRGVIETAFERSAKSNASEYLEELRLTVTEPVIRYSDKVKTARTVSDYCRALFEFLEDINLYQGLKNELLSMAINNATADAQRFGQVWNLMLSVLDEVNTALGAEQATHEEFCNYMTAAMSRCQIRTIPSGIDRVFIGDADMNRAIPTPVVFVMGAVAGTFPSISMREGFLSNADRTALSEKNLRLAPTTLKKAEKQTNTVYKLMSAAMDRLYLSYPSMNPKGDGNLPSQTVTDIMAKLKNMPATDDIIDGDGIMYISSPKATMHRFLMNGTVNPLWSHVDAWFSEHDEWKNKLFTVKKAKRSFKHRKIELNPEIAHQLYEGKTRYSATRLNTYAGCPFGHFMQYGLSAKEREEYEIRAKDTGSYAHEIISRFCDRVDKDTTLSWDTVDDDKCTELVSEIVADTLDKINSSDLNNKEMTADILRRMGDTVTAAAKTVCKSIRCGGFETEGYEKEVTVKLTDSIELGGIIDRLDVCRHDGVNEYRIIDYKTGEKSFSAADIYNGLDMQPVIYALAMRMTDDKAVISGMYYSLMHNDFPKVNSNSGEKKIKSDIAKNTAYNGVMFVGNDKNSEPPIDEINRIESELSRAEGSLFFPGKTDPTSYGKTIRTRPEGEWLMEKVRDNIINADREIHNGNIAISPLVSSKSPCTYCAYASACRFDEDVKADRTIAETDEEIWTKLEEER